MRITILAAMVMVMLAGCGGGGTTTSTVADTAAPAVQKVSAVDGVWEYGVTVDGIMHWIGLTKFSDGVADYIGVLGSLNISKTGTFAVSGNTLTVTYTHSSASPSGLTLADLGNVHSIDTNINEVSIYTFTVTPQALTLTNSAGVVKVYTK